jgi:hypothetical protein
VHFNLVDGSRRKLAVPGHAVAWTGMTAVLRLCFNHTSACLWAAAPVLVGAVVFVVVGMAVWSDQGLCKRLALPGSTVQCVAVVRCLHSGLMAGLEQQCQGFTVLVLSQGCWHACLRCNTAGMQRLSTRAASVVACSESAEWQQRCYLEKHMCDRGRDASSPCLWCYCCCPGAAHKCSPLGTVLPIAGDDIV